MNSGVHVDVGEKMHEFSNIAAVVFLLAFAAVYRSHGCDIAGLLVREQTLKPAVNGLFVHTLMITTFSASIIFSLHRLDVIVDWYQAVLAGICCFLAVVYQVWSGYRQIS